MPSRASVRRTVREAEDLLAALRGIDAIPLVDEGLRDSAEAYVSRKADAILADGPEDAMREGLRRYGQEGLRQLVRDSVRVSPEGLLEDPQAQDLLIGLERELVLRPARANLDSLKSSASALALLVGHVRSLMTSGWWLFPNKARRRVYEGSDDIRALLDGKEGLALRRCALTLQTASAVDVPMARGYLGARLEDYTTLLQQLMSTFLSEDDGLRGLTTQQSLLTSKSCQEADDILKAVAQMSAAEEVAKSEVRTALDLCLGTRADKVFDATPAALRREILRLYGGEALHDAVERNVRLHPMTIGADALTRRLLTSTVRYAEIAEAVREAFRSSATLNDLRALGIRARQVKPNLGWVLLSDEERGSVLDAARRLGRLLDSPACDGLRSSARRAREARGINWNGAKRELEARPDLAIATLRRLAPAFIGPCESVGGLTESDAAQADALAADVAALLKDVEAAKTIKPDSEAIRIAVNSYASVKAREEAAKTPVDVINQGSRQFQLKGLKEHGINTVKDLDDAYAYQLDSVRGMGRGVAYEAKRVAADYLEYLKRGVRIRLSLDDDVPAMVDLLVAVAFYQSQSNAGKRLGSLCAITDRLDDLGNKTSTLKLDLTWVIRSEDERQALIQAAEEPRGNLESTEVATLREAITSLKDLAKPTQDEAREAYRRDPVGFVTILEKVVPEAMANDNGSYGLTDELAEKADSVSFSDAGLKVTLRPYQVWGVKYALAQKRVLLGDEMGLGKTVQALGVMVALRAMGLRRFMVVCPLSVLENWCREIEGKTDLRPIRIHGQESEAMYRRWQRSLCSIAVTTYETLGRLGSEGVRLDCLVVDEAHYAKNPNARRTKNVKRFVDIAAYVLFMTGTALENKAEEMVQLIGMLQPEVAEKARAEIDRPYGDAFRNTVACVYYRRKREDVLQELPELVENEEWCALLQEEIPSYVTALQEGFASARRVSWNVGDLSHSSKARRLREIVAQAQDENRKVLVFSFFRKTLEEMTELLEGRCIGPINGSVPAQKRQEMVDRFEGSPAGTALVAQIQAGGTGLNIQAASVVVLCEPQYKPSIENQAISRAYRMGQTRSVLVFRLLSTDTIDERIMEILEQKQRIFDTFADKSVAAAQMDDAINTETMNDIVREELEKYAGMGSGEAMPR